MLKSTLYFVAYVLCLLVQYVKCELVQLSKHGKMHDFSQNYHWFYQDKLAKTSPAKGK